MHCWSRVADCRGTVIHCRYVCIVLVVGVANSSIGTQWSRWSWGPSPYLGDHHTPTSNTDCHTGLHPSVRIIGLTNIYFHFYVHTKINIDIIEKWLKVTKCRSRNTFVNSWTHFFMLKIISITFSTWIFVTTISLPRDLRDLFYRLSSWATTYAELSH